MSFVQGCSNCLQVAQQKADSLSNVLHSELAKRGKPPAPNWQQQRLQLRPISQSRSPASSRGSSPGSSRGNSPVGSQKRIDAPVDTLLQQRAKLRHVQTSVKGSGCGRPPASGAPVEQQPTNVVLQSADQMPNRVNLLNSGEPCMAGKKAARFREIKGNHRSLNRYTQTCFTF